MMYRNIDNFDQDLPIWHIIFNRIVDKFQIQLKYLGTNMCLGIPARILEINGDIAKVDFGGITREVDISLVDVKLNDYVIVHAGFAIQILSENEAKVTIELFQQILDAEEIEHN